MIGGLTQRGMLICCLLGAALTVGAQPTKVWRIGWLGIDSSMQATRYTSFLQGLRELGYVEGKNVVIEQRWAEGRFENLPKLAQELVALHVDVIVTASPTAVKAAMSASSKIPIAMIVHEPVAMGFAESLARPGKNVTGIAFQDTDLTTKRLELFRQAVPKMSRIAIVWNVNGTDAKSLQTVVDTAKTMGMQVLTLEVREARDIAKAVTTAKGWGAQGIVQLSSPFITMNRQVLIAALARDSMPATCEMRMYVDDGCLMTYSAHLDSMFRRLASHVDRILQGTNPADMAIEQPREFEFVINLKTAQALGLPISTLLRYQTTDTIPVEGH